MILGPDDSGKGPGGITIPFLEFCEDALTCLNCTVRKYSSRPQVLVGLLLSIVRLPKRSTIIFHATWRALITLGPLLILFKLIRGHVVVCRKFAGDCDRRYEHLTRIGRYIIRGVLRTFDCFYAETNYLVQWARDLGANAAWWPNGRRVPDALEGSGIHSQAIKDVPVFAFLGRVCRDKGVFLLDRYTADDIGNINIDVWGPIDKAEADEINLLFTKSDGRIRYRGVLARDDVADTLQGYSALILPTSWQSEGYPGVIIEAAMLGVPSIVSRSRGPAEIVEMLECGYVTDAEAPRLVRAEWNAALERRQKMACFARAQFDSREIHARVIGELKAHVA